MTNRKEEKKNKMKRIIVQYSEDFHKNEVASRIYGLLRGKGFDPISIHVHYQVSVGLGEAEYAFENRTILPKKPELEEMLKGTNITSLGIFDSEEVAE